MGDEDAKLVAKGSFRVDRQRALEKLERFQLGDPRLGLYFWIRCAVASGATGCQVSSGPASFTVSFDGEPLTADELRDPYGALFEAESPRRRRHLAYAMLWVMRLGPSEATLVSGPPDGRLKLTAHGLSGETVAPEALPARDTVLRVSGLWRHALSRPWSLKPGDVDRLCAAAPCRLSIGGQGTPGPVEGPSDLVFELPAAAAAPGARVVMRPAPDLPRQRNSALIHQDGFLVGTFSYSQRFLPAESVVEAPDVALDASQTAAVRDGRMDALLDAIAARERALLERILDTGAPGGLDAAAARQAGYTLLNDPLADLAEPLLAKLWKAPLFPGKRSFDDVMRRPYPADAEDGAETSDLALFRRRVRPPP